jgi:16S rRNA processing protein RimM
VEPETDNPARFLPGKVVYLKGRPYTINESRRTSQGLLLELDGLGDGEARQLTHEPVEVPAQDVPPAPEGTYYHFQILDLEVFDLTGTYLGKVTEVLSTGANDVYVVTTGDQELLVPAMQDVIVSVDMERRRMAVNLPPGLEPRPVHAPRKRPAPKRRRSPPRTQTST